ncbi:hypothetical protein B0T19DRAFT_488362 [Cercophora scortea]|uniref:Uncharacterized protein n=1 Tax=Cercophora scortea TaxID=314031 RepID=A0AAE0M5I1_9PEZI|nr:hypothetical protein B0T19DRAFT_488362 [Cercophora scortea]
MSNYTIQTGVWVNYDTSPALGATLTVSIRWGNYLIAALSSLVAWAGASAWSIVSYALHQRLAAVRNKDVLHQQLQVHFRTGGSFLDSWFDGLHLHRAWKGRVGHVRRRTLTVSVLALILFLVFTAAGIFVAEVATKSYQDVLVLAAPNDCGNIIFQDQPGRHNAVIDEVFGLQNDIYFWARNYARDIKAQGRESSFSVPSLPFTSHEMECPYSNGTTCLGANRTQGPAWMMESGPLNSHTHFGINAPEQDRVTWGVIGTCAVVDAQNLTIAPYWRMDNYNGTQINNSYVGILQQFGPDLGYDSNLMFEVPVNLMYERTGFFSQRGMWSPITETPDKAITGPPFDRKDADMVMITTTQGLMFYYQPVDDPYFFAHRAVTGDEYATDMNTTVYYSSQLFGLMVCSEQQQLCNPNTNQCTNWNASQGVYDAVQYNTLDLNNAQLATAMAIVSSLQHVGGFLGFSARGTSNLMIAEQRGVRSGSSVPPNQWIKEVELWFAANLAGIQNTLLLWIAKPWPQGHPETLYQFVNLTYLDLDYAKHNVTREKDTICHSQLIRSSAAVQNFSVLALVIVIVICTAVIVAGLLLPGCISFSRNRRRMRGKGLSPAAEAGRVARIADAKYNVLAMALQGAGVGGWERRGGSEIPVTKGPVAILPPMEKDGMAAYPCAACVICRVPTGESESESDGKAAGEKKPVLKVDTEVVACDGDNKEKRKGSKGESFRGLDRHLTEVTLVASPVEVEDKGRHDR